VRAIFMKMEVMLTSKYGTRVVYMSVKCPRIPDDEEKIKNKTEKKFRNRIIRIKDVRDL